MDERYASRDAALIAFMKAYPEDFPEKGKQTVMYSSVKVHVDDHTSILQKGSSLKTSSTAGLPDDKLQCYVVCRFIQYKCILAEARLLGAAKNKRKMQITAYRPTVTV